MKTIKKLLLILCITLLFNCKESTSNNNALLKTEIDSTSIDTTRVVKSRQTSIIDNGDTFYRKGQDVFYNCNKVSTIINNRLFDINSIKKSEVLKMETVKGFSKYFKKILGRDVLNCFYYGSFNLTQCSAIFCFENEDETYSSYLFLFDDRGKFVSKLLLSEINQQDAPGLHVYQYSEILLDQKTIKVTVVNTMIDEYNNESDFSEIVDSIKIKYIINKDNEFFLKDKDSVRNKVITKH